MPLRETLHSISKTIEVKPTDDEYEKIDTTRWGNRDTYPVPSDKRTYGVYAYMAYWGTCGICLSSFTIGSSLIGIGLTAWQAMISVVFGMILACGSAYFSGVPGAKFHLGYGAFARAAWGLWGSYFCIMLNIFQCFVFYGTQMYFGGEAFVIILNSIFPSFLRLENTLPSSAGLSTKELIGFILFICLYFPVIYFVPAHKVVKLLEANVIISAATLCGILGWAIHMNGGSPGDLVRPAIQLTKMERGFRVIQGITSVAGTYTGGSDRLSDWSRYSKRRHSSTPAIPILGVTVILTSLMGVLTASALTEYYGEAAVQWNPLLSLQRVQVETYTAKCRAGTFFAGMGLLSVTVFVNYTMNCVSSGMDMAILLPKYLSQRRGALVFSVLGILAQPWRFLSQATTFITVLASFGVFMSPAASILVVDFWLVRKQKWNIPELFRAHGIYWFWNGLNWRAFVAYTLGMFPALPGFIAEVQPSIHVSDTWRRFFQISFFFGYIVSGTIHYLLNKYFPPPGLGEQVNFEIDQGVIEVMDSSSEHGPEYLKTAEATETKV